MKNIMTASVIFFTLALPLAAETVTANATLTVQPPLCIMVPATVTLAPSSQTARFPKTAAYTLNVTNNDIGPRASSTYSVVPSGTPLDGGPTLTLSSSVPQLVIAPGASMSATITVSADSAPVVDNNYQISVAVTRPNAPANLQAAAFTMEPPKGNYLKNDKVKPGKPSNLKENKKG